MLDFPPPAVAPTQSATAFRLFVILFDTNFVGLLIGPDNHGTELPTPEQPPEIPQMEFVQKLERVPGRDSFSVVYPSARNREVPSRSQDSESAPGYPLELKFAER